MQLFVNSFLFFLFLCPFDHSRLDFYHANRGRVPIQGSHLSLMYSAGVTSKPNAQCIYWCLILDARTLIVSYLVKRREFPWAIISNFRFKLFHNIRFPPIVVIDFCFRIVPYFNVVIFQCKAPTYWQQNRMIKLVIPSLVKFRHQNIIEPPTQIFTSV